MRPIDADALVEGIKELKRSPWYNGENGNYERLVRSDAIGTVVDLCIKAAPTLEYVPRQQWISVKDRLPAKGEKVLVRGVRGGIQAGIFRGLLGENVSMWWWKKNSSLEVVCWMSQSTLPEAPKEG